MDQKIDLVDVVAEVKRLGQEFPDSYYVRTFDEENGNALCLYTKGLRRKQVLGNLAVDTPCGCIIGTALTNLYPWLQPVLAEIDAKMPVNIAGLLTKHLNTYLVVRSENTDLIMKLSDIQWLQDNLKPWGKATAT